MKKLLLTAMIAALLALPMGNVALAEHQEAAQSPVQEAMDYAPGDVPAETDALESMTPAVHAVILAMVHQDRTAFDRNDTALVWEALYNMLSLYGQRDVRSEYLDEELVLPVEALGDFSAALTPDVQSLGQLPADLTDRMVYDPEIDSYRLVCGNDSLAQIRLTDSRQTGGALEITGALVYLVDDTDLAQFRATLQPQDNMFGYTIATLELL